MTKRDKVSIFSLPAKNMRFDIPLHARVGTEFLAFLMALMAFLCVLAGCISLSLNNLTEAWTTGLADTVTIEIPHADDNEKTLEELKERLEKIEHVRSVDIVDRKELSSLVEPWLGKNLDAIEDLPVPVLINVAITERNKDIIQKIDTAVKSEIPAAQVDAHEGWLRDIAKLSRGLQMAGAALIVAIGFVTALTVSGAVRSRMAIHHTELELLHIMGASDSYITKQFQKYILVLSGRGICIGLILAALFILVAHLLALRLPDTLPNFNFTLGHVYIVAAIAALLLAISTFAARQTVMSVLKEMP